MMDIKLTRPQSNDRPPVESFELEIEVIDVPRLVAEGLKEERGEPNRYDEMVTSILDSARILIRNIVRDARK
jgi:polynucleotide 5'-triphosphatase